MDYEQKRRRFLQMVTVVGGAGLAGCGGDGGGDDGGGGDGGDGGDGGGGTTTTAGGDGGGDGMDSPWVYDQPQEEPDELIWLNAGDMGGDPATAYHAETFSEEVGVPINPQTVPTPELLNRTRTLLQSESDEVDVYQTQTSGAWGLGVEGFWERLDPFIETFDAWIPAAQTASTFPIDLPGWEDFPYPEGIYSTPWFMGGNLMYTNFEVLEAVGLDRDWSPATYSELRDGLEMMTDVVDTPILAPFAGATEGNNLTANLVARAGGQYFTDGEFTFTMEETVTALEFILGLVNDGYMPQGITSTTEQQAYSNFFAGNAGVLFGAGNAMFGGEGEVSDAPPPELSRVHTFPRPDGVGEGETPTGHATYASASLSIFSRHKELGARFMNHITKQEQQAQELLKEGNLPLRADAFDVLQVQEELPYPDTFKEHVAGLDALIYPAPAEVESAIYQEMTSSMGSGRGGQETAQAIQDQVSDLI